MLKSDSNSLILLNTISNHLKKDNTYLEQFGDAYPFIVHLNRIKDFRITYINSKVQDMIQVSPDDVLKFGLSIWYELYPRDSLNFVQKFTINNLKPLQSGKTLLYSQLIRPQNARKHDEFITYRKMLNNNEFLSLSFPSSFYLQNKDQEAYIITAEQNDYSLTKRELQILQLVAKGYNSKKIAEQLHLSHHTVDTHRRNIIKKAQSENCVGAYEKMQN